MKGFSPGEILVVNFPYREDPTRFSRRPAMVISKIDDSHYKMSQITRTDRTGIIKGLWVEKDSVELKEMGIREPSFINLQNILTLSTTLIIYGPIGHYPNVEQLLLKYGV